jgi:hypothetical protein
VDEVQRHAHQVDLVMGQLVHPALDVTPVVLVDPVVDQLAVVGGVVAVPPVVVAEILGKAGAAQPLVHVLEGIVVDRDGEILHLATRSRGHKDLLVRLPHCRGSGLAALRVKIRGSHLHS